MTYEVPLKDILQLPRGPSTTIVHGMTHRL